MRRTYTRLIAGASAIAAAALAVFALRPPTNTGTPVAARNPVVEVRTVVVRRTIHIVKHVRPAGASPVHGQVNGHSGQVYGHSGVAVARTGASGSHSAGSTVAVAGTVSTRTSGSHPVVGAPAGAPVTTRSSASHGSTGSGSTRPVTTRTSSGSSRTGSGSVTTRTSGGSHHDDGGDGGGDN